MKITASTESSSLLETAFTKAVNLVQSSLVPALVKGRIERRQRKVGAPPPALDRKMRELGLATDRLWWGPMTLFPRKTEFLIQAIESRPPRHVLEVGGGTSTAVFAALAEKYDFDVLTLENHESSIGYIEALLSGLPCSRRVEVVKCGFKRAQYPDGRKYRWYDIDLAARKTQYDFVLIDGPMGTLVGRNGALPEIRPYLADDCRIFLDDAQREHEKQCIAEWLSYFPGLAVERLPECPGLAALHFQPQPHQ